MYFEKQKGNPYFIINYFDLVTPVRNLVLFLHALLQIGSHFSRNKFFTGHRENISLSGSNDFN